MLIIKRREQVDVCLGGIANVKQSDVDFQNVPLLCMKPSHVEKVSVIMILKTMIPESRFTTMTLECFLYCVVRFQIFVPVMPLFWPVILPVISPLMCRVFWHLGRREEALLGQAALCKSCTDSWGIYWLDVIIFFIYGIMKRNTISICIIRNIAFYLSIQ